MRTPQMKLLGVPFEIRLPHQSVTPLLSGAPLLRKFLDPPLDIGRYSSDTCKVLDVSSVI